MHLEKKSMRARRSDPERHSHDWALDFVLDARGRTALARCCRGLTDLNISANIELDHESLRALEGLPALVTLDARFISTESFASFVARAWEA
mgnify:CR=1 FL=1